MKIELKNVKIGLAFSEETICFTADIFANGVKIGYAKNDGNGGCTYYNSYENKRDLIKTAEEYAKTLPPTIYKEFTLESNLENIIDGIIDKMVADKENAKLQKKLVKLTENNIVFGVPNSNKYSYIGFKGKVNLKDRAKTQQGREAITKLYNRIKGELKQDEEIFNKNLEQIIV